MTTFNKTITVTIEPYRDGEKDLVSVVVTHSPTNEVIMSAKLAGVMSEDQRLLLANHLLGIGVQGIKDFDYRLQNPLAGMIMGRMLAAKRVLEEDDGGWGGQFDDKRKADPTTGGPSPAEETGRSERATVSGRPPAPGMEHDVAPQPINPKTGQHKDYYVLPEEERAKGFIRPVRDAYTHTKCGKVTSMGRALAETYARDPNYYSSTFCCQCRTHLPVAEFTWYPDGQVVGS